MDDAPRRVILLLIGRNSLMPAEPFVACAETIASDLRKTMQDQRPPTPKTVRAALRDLVADGYLVVVQPPSGSAPGRYAFGPKIAVPP